MTQQADERGGRGPEVAQLREAGEQLARVVEHVLDWRILDTQAYSLKWGVDWLYSQNRHPDVTALAQAYLDYQRALAATGATGEGGGEEES